MTTSVVDWVARLEAGDRRAAARLITRAEGSPSDARAIMRALHPRTGNAHVIGVTGPPGSGKSTLVDRLIAHYRAAEKTVGVVAVDPTSPFTGGAVLGDRVRMQARATDRGVFIRSMGNRGALGGLSRACHDAIRVLDAFGKDVILVETVGVGQAEVDVVKVADTVAVVAVPGMGDGVQHIKAGIMEIGDVFVLNKADHDGADRTQAELQAWLEFKHDAHWVTPVCRTVAEKGDGVPELAATLDKHRAMLEASGGLAERRRGQAEHEMLEILRAEVMRFVMDEEKAKAKFQDYVEKVAARAVDPYAAADAVLAGFQADR